MRTIYRVILVFAVFLTSVTAGNFTVKADEPIRPEVRALWVDAFCDGAKTPAQIDRLIQDALHANINTLVVQVRRRGDAYYNQSIEPRTEDPVLPPGFDALQYLIERAHAHQIEVHAWLNTLVAWNSAVPPKDPNHVWNLHGPGTTGRSNWVSYYRTYDKTTQAWSDTVSSSYYLDPGHPDALDYTVAVYLNVVKNYDVDGIHLDYSRYAGTGWGYNPTSLARYNAQSGTTGWPAPDDPEWAQWRREQTANLVRKVYLKAIALKPHLKVSSAVITWGDGPVNDGDWEKSRAYVQVYQDWQGWLQEGIIDMVMPMNYFNEWNGTQQVWYNRWIEWEKDHQSGRQIVIGPGVYSQYIEDSLAQIRRAQAPSAQGNRVAGVCLFSYGASHLYSNNDYHEPGAGRKLPRQPHLYMAQSNYWLFVLLAQEGGYPDPVLHAFIATQPVFPSRAAVPDMPWKSDPKTGYLMGSIANLAGETAGAGGHSADHVKVTVESIHAADVGIHRAVYTDGSGWFGMTELPPGEYRVSLAEEFAGEKICQIAIQPGRVAEVRFE